MKQKTDSELSLEAASNFFKLRHFIGQSQKLALRELLKGEEKQFFRDKLAELVGIVEKMPVSYQTDGQGENAIAWLHYFTPNSDFYITERDMGCADDEIEGLQNQAFGLAVVFESELGYISLPEIFKAGAEIDLYWQPKTLAEVKKEMPDRF